jgi:putative transposase
MARLPRYVLPGHPQHVIQRGNNRNVIFASEEDYSFYRECLKKACSEHKVLVHAYVFMTNHVHLLMTPQTEYGLAKVMQSVGRRYVQYFNYAYRRTGTLWEGRYKATLIDTENYLLTCYRYIELNPVRANMVSLAEEYRWSSYHFNARGEFDELLTPHALYEALGRTPATRVSVYRALFKNHIDETTMMEIRNATNKAWVLGNDHFRNEIESLLNRQTHPSPKGGDRRSEKFQNKLL